MNNQKTIKKLAQLTEQSYDTCQEIAAAYEKYCEEHAQMPFSKNIDEQLIFWICQTTNHESEIVANVVETLELIVREEVKRKIPFTK